MQSLLLRLLEVDTTLIYLVSKSLTNNQSPLFFKLLPLSSPRKKLFFFSNKLQKGTMVKGARTGEPEKWAFWGRAERDESSRSDMKRSLKTRSSRGLENKGPLRGKGCPRGRLKLRSTTGLDLSILSCYYFLFRKIIKLSWRHLVCWCVLLRRI